MRDDRGQGIDAAGEQNMYSSLRMMQSLRGLCCILAAPKLMIRYSSESKIVDRNKIDRCVSRFRRLYIPSAWRCDVSAINGQRQSISTQMAAGKNITSGFWPILLYVTRRTTTIRGHILMKIPNDRCCSIITKSTCTVMGSLKRSGHTSCTPCQNCPSIQPRRRYNNPSSCATIV